MLTLTLAVMVASFLGSFHCVGMCGPFAVLAAHGGPVARCTVAYHVGRLTTYLSAGLLAGVVGTMLHLSGELAGIQSIAARLAGGLLVVVGAFKLLRLWPRFGEIRWFGANKSVTSPTGVAGMLLRLRPWMAGHGALTRAYLTGLFTTWLPCGWLYLFVLFAAGTGGVVPSLVVMIAFWIGSLPALTALSLGATRLLPRLQSSLPMIAALVLILTGFYTATGRASADLSAMKLPRLQIDSADSLVDLADEPLPCCQPVSP
jgi:sulfite exporter TauE/SafE